MNKYTLKFTNGDILQREGNSPSEIMDKMVGKNNYVKCQRYQADVIVDLRKNGRHYESFYYINMTTKPIESDEYTKLCLYAIDKSNKIRDKYNVPKLNKVEIPKAFSYLHGAIEQVALKEGKTVAECNKIVDSIANNLKKSNQGKVILNDYINITDMKNKIAIRVDIEKSLQKYEPRRLAGLLDYGFREEDLSNLAKLHKAKKYTVRIEILLKDCNFNKECRDFLEGKYEEYIID